MSEPVPAPRFTLRALPFPAKVVITLFLLTVGLGYSSAMVQMHFQHTQGDGSPLPGPNDVIEIFAGKKRLTKDDIAKNRPVSKIEKLVTGPIDGPLNGGGSMGSAFFKNDRSEAGNRYKDVLAKRPKEEVEAEREGERKLMVLWVNAPEAERAKAYADNLFAPARNKAPTKMSPEYIHNDGGFLIQHLFRDRCTSCHRDGEQAGNFPLVNYEQIAKYAECAPAPSFPKGKRAPGAPAIARSARKSSPSPRTPTCSASPCCSRSPGWCSRSRTTRSRCGWSSGRSCCWPR